MADQIQYTLSTAGIDGETAAVTSFTGREALSTPFEFVIDFCSTSAEPLPYGELPGKKATLSFTTPHGRERHVNGKIASVEALGSREGRPRYRALLVPRLAELGHTRRVRIFQQLSTVDIVKKVLAAEKVALKVSVSGSYQPRDYCVQYGESDMHFVRRLLEEEGIFFYFEHTADEHTMVLVDATSACPSSDSVLPFRGEGGAVNIVEHVSQFGAGHRLRPGKVTLRDFNFLTPALDLTAHEQGESANQEMERYEHPGVYLASGAGSARAKVRLQEEQRDLAFHEGESDAAGLLPGYTFDVTEHPVPASDGTFLVVAINHRGTDSLYRNRATSVPASHPWRPPRELVKPLAPGVQTAIVVGPAGEEIFTDQHGRVKVQFHWDREGKSNDTSSCWVRVSQAWAGAGWGALYLPRIGHEVVVRFEDGDPDRPLVVGSVYNGANQPPYALPDEKTKSTLRSSSSPGGNGSNELRYEDLAGQEEIYAHAQKDEEIVVENDKTQEVRHDETLTVKKDRHREIDKNQTLKVHGQDVSVIEKNQTLTVKQARTTTTVADSKESVDGNQSITVSTLHTLSVSQDSTEDIGLVKAITVGGLLAVVVGDGIEETIDGARVRAVGGLHEEWVRGGREEIVEKDLTLTVGGAEIFDIHKGEMTFTTKKDSKGEVGGDETWVVKEESQWRAKTLEIKADTLSFVVNDKKLLSMAKSGDLKLSASKLIIDGKQIKGKGKTIDMVAAGSAPSGKAKEAKPKELKGKDKKIIKPTLIKMTNVTGSPTAGLKFTAELPDGTKIDAKLSPTGEASIEGVEKGDIKIEFPDLDEKEWSEGEGGKSG
jgi:type VI secretion system secreted protein VgrG